MEAWLIGGSFKKHLGKSKYCNVYVKKKRATFFLSYKGLGSVSKPMPCLLSTGAR